MASIFKLFSFIIVFAISLLLLFWALGVLPQGQTQEVYVYTLLVLVVSISAVGLVGLMLRHKN